MKVAVSTSKGGLDDNIFPNFGRCPSFTIVDTAEKEWAVRVMDNPGAGAGGGAGISAAQAVAESKADAVVTGSCGPNALAVLLASGIKVYLDAGNVKKAVESLLQGNLVPIDRPTAQRNAGLIREMSEGRGGRRR
ncbi:NifB/NifX family molybdenum-iron cluster-binding protein [Candidatus Micrarchaeota archaeon]|nr:NifB/NifX family molybdenum-iron cluster-binding protein [Candidatus Micrarchaeota archaeon]